LDLFCKQTIEQFPANRYGLFIITVGVGWQGVCADFQTYPDFKIITINELGKMLSRLTNNGESKIDILSIVACLESMIEVAIEIESYIEYFIASEADNTALQVWPNLSSIKKIKNNTNISSENFVKDIVQNQNTYNINLKPKIFDILLKNRIFKILNFVTIHTSLSAINLSKIEILKNKINNLSQLLILNIKENNVIESIKKARKEVREYGKWSPKYHILYKPKFCPLYDLLPLEQFAFDCYIDLYDFVNILKENVENNFIKISCEDVMNNINETVFSIAKTKNDTQTHGLSVYFPEKSKQFNQFLFPGKLPCLYENLKFSIETKWDEFIKTYLNI